MTSYPTRLAVAILTVALSACGEPTSLPVPAPPAPRFDPVPVPTTPSHVVTNAGADVLIPLGAGAATLSVNTYAYGRQVVSYAWKKVSGPGSPAILTPGLEQTQVANLELGTYEFQVTATDNIGNSGTATVRIIVYNPGLVGAYDLVFTNREWLCPMGCHLIIARFQGPPPDLETVSVFLKTNGQWAKIKRDSEGPVSWFFDRGILALYTNDDPLSREDIKIVF